MAGMGKEQFGVAGKQDGDITPGALMGFGTRQRETIIEVEMIFRITLLFALDSITTMSLRYSVVHYI